MRSRSGYRLPVDSELDEETESLNAAVAESSGLGLEIYVPEDNDYHKWVARTGVSAVDRPEDQIEEMARFYRTFVSAFLAASPPDSDDREMMTYLKDWHNEVAGPEAEE